MAQTRRSLTLTELAAEAGAPPALVERLVELGQLRPDQDGLFDARGFAIIATIQALLGTGISDDDLDWMVRHAGGGYQAVAPLFLTPAPRTGPTYAELVASLGPLGPRLADFYVGFGLPEPEPDRPMREDEVSIVRRFVALWDLVDHGGDLDVRTARLAGDSSRRVVEGWLEAWTEAAQPGFETQGAPAAAGRPIDPADPDQNPSIGAAVLVRDLLGWLQERHLEVTLNQRIIAAAEVELIRNGRLTARPDLPPAVAFVDLTGYTTLTESQGDQAAALTAVRLAALADACARAFGGRVVKLLGDGVLLRFDDPRTAVDAVLDLLDEIDAAGLPTGHAGIAAGRIVVRDGDIYGRTVNLAARISAHAAAGQLLVDGEVAEVLEDRGRLAPAGKASLKGISEPVPLWSVARG